MTNESEETIKEVEEKTARPHRLEQLIQDVMRSHPALTRQEAIEHLEAAGA